MTKPSPIHLIVEAGPQKGQELHIPLDGVRVGRSSNNDVVIKDPAMSRFHCRFYFKPGEGLWAADLGSANQTMLNDKRLHESRLYPGDRLVMGDSTLKVLSDQLPDGTAAQQLFDSAPPAAAASRRFDFRRSDESAPGRQRRLIVLLIAAGIMALAVVMIFTLKFRTAPAAMLPVPAAATALPALEIQYEKVQASSKNIFRYALTLQDRELSIQIDDLQNKRHVPGDQRKKVEADLVQSLAESILHSDFFTLKESFKGLPADDIWDSVNLSITLGTRTRRVTLLNALEPEALKSVRETIEEFGQNELGLGALALAPDKLVEMARAALLLGRSRYDQRAVKNENLALAIRSLKEAEWYLETIEPKPDFYADAVALRTESERELQAVFENHMFLAERAVKLKEWPEAAMQLRLICEIIPDRSDERYQQANKKLIDVERHLKKK